jgi:hypothetical protein
MGTPSFLEAMTVFGEGCHFAVVRKSALLRAGIWPIEESVTHEIPRVIDKPAKDLASGCDVDVRAVDGLPNFVQESGHFLRDLMTIKSVGVPGGGFTPLFVAQHIAPKSVRLWTP